MEPSFIHLRVHTEYSLIDGIVQIPELIEQVVKLHMPALAITDQNNLFATVKFYQAALRSGIKPIIGSDLLICNEKNLKKPHRISLYCQNQQGYQNLLSLISKAYIDGQTIHCISIQKEWLKNHSEGLIVLSGEMAGDLGEAILADDQKNIKESITFWQHYFPDRYYIELQRTGRDQEEFYISNAIQCAIKNNLPLVATNDVRFLFREDFEAHETRVCIHDGTLLTDSRRAKKYTDQQYLRSPSEMKTLFSDIPEALINTVEIAKRCNVKLSLGKNYLPKFKVPENSTTESYLIELSKSGLEERLQNHPFPKTQYDLRLNMELDVINKMGFAGYFLIVADFTRWARENDVPVGPGRGSGPGSLVAYALKITDLDPLKHELLFERFLNPERVSMPDFDIDFCMEGRDRVIEYVMQTHGYDCVAQIITYGTMAARAVVRDVGRVLAMPYGYVDKIAKLIPFEIGITLEKSIQQVEQLRERYEKEDDVRTLFELAKKLEGITRNVGKHAGGVVIAPGKLTEFTPLYCESLEKDSSSKQHFVTQFDKDDVEAVGLVKFDFLGLKTLTIIHHAIKYINQFTKIDIQHIPMHDEKTFALLKACQTTAVFQLESRGMKDLVKRLQPDCFEDIVALVALFRPGPLQSGMVDDFINRKHGRAKVFYPHPKLEPILRQTYGVILYQEQVMQIAQVLAGYSLGAADLLRRAMGKKKPEEMAKQREIFCKGSVDRDVPLETANHIFDLMEKFAGYGFNKSHSASYALISYQTAWLKTHYAAAFMAAVLSADMDHTEKVVHFIEECQFLNLKISPPNINDSDYIFTVKDETNLIYGLGAIKGAGQAAIELIISARKNKPFEDLFDFCCRVDSRKVNRRVIEALIKAGTFDLIGPNRASIMASVTLALQHAEQTLRNQIQGQHDLFGSCESEISRPSYIITNEWNDHERLLGEKETLGLYLSGHPIYRYHHELKNFTTCRIAEIHPGFNQKPIIAGIITQIRSLMTKRGDRMAVITIEDGSGKIDALCFSEIYQKYFHLLQKDNLIIIQGEVSIDEFNDSLRMMVKEISTIENARSRHAKFLQILLSGHQTNDLITLSKILEKYRGGSCPIKINYERSDAAAHLNLGEQWKVNPSDELIKKLKDIFSEKNIMMVY